VKRVYYRVELVIYEYEQGEEEDDLTCHMDREEVISTHNDREDAHLSLDAIMVQLGLG
jgi:hypothetical protein